MTYNASSQIHYKLFDGYYIKMEGLTFRPAFTVFEENFCQNRLNRVYFEMNNPTEEIVGEFGYSFFYEVIELPEYPDDDADNIKNLRGTYYSIETVSFHRRRKRSECKGKSCRDVIHTSYRTGASNFSQTAFCRGFCRNRNRNIWDNPCCLVEKEMKKWIHRQ